MDELIIQAPGDALAQFLLVILYIPLQIFFGIINLWTELLNAF